MSTQGQLQTIRYRTKKDAWIVILIFMALLLPPAATIYVFTRLGDFIEGLLLLLLSIVVWALILGIAFPVYYEITASTLLIRSGVLRHEVPLSAIRRVQPVSVSPHGIWSLNQVRVDYQRDNLHYLSAIFVAPTDKTSFMNELKARSPHIEIRHVAPHR